MDEFIFSILLAFALLNLQRLGNSLFISKAHFSFFFLHFSSVTGSYLYRMLRPELVQKWKKPLCADAFSNFQSTDPDRLQNNEDIKEAFEDLLHKAIPSFAAFFDDACRTNPTLSANYDFLRTEMQKRGINARFLGLILNHIPNPSTSLAAKKVVTAMVCRAAKMSLRSLLRNAMKAIALANDEPYIRVTVDYFNILFGASTDSMDYWAMELNRTIQCNFYYHAQSKVNLETLKELTDLKELFHLLVQFSGVVLSPKFSSDRDLVKSFKLNRFISESDIAGMEPISKQPAFLMQSEALAQWQQSQLTLNQEEKTKTLSRCIDIILPVIFPLFAFPLLH
jgi:hypothetical protein